MKQLTRDFYRRNPEVVAPELLGKVLWRDDNGIVLAGIIVETEAYLAKGDEASHSYSKPSKRTRSLYLDAGHIYVHQIHSQNCLDIVCNSIGIGGSVLIRAIEPIEGIEIMKKNRARDSIYELTSGPGKLCKALNIDRNLDGIDITSRDSTLKVYCISDREDFEITTTSRIGISKSQGLNLRFLIKGNRFISRKNPKIYFFLSQE